MVLFVDLEDETAEPPEIVTPHWQRFNERSLRTAKAATLDEARLNPNKNAITEALGCYPYVLSVSSRPRANFGLHEADSGFPTALLCR